VVQVRGSLSPGCCDRMTSRVRMDCIVRRSLRGR
jgi:hypothetical protein